MNIGLISDTHIPEAMPELPAQIRQVFADTEIILHAGDLHCLTVLDWLEEIAPVPQQRGLSSPCAPARRWAAGRAGGGGAPGDTPAPRGRRGRRQGRGRPAGWRQKGFEFPIRDIYHVLGPV